MANTKYTVTSQQVLDELERRKFFVRDGKIYDPRKRGAYCYLEDGGYAGDISFPSLRVPKKSGPGGGASGAHCSAVQSVIDELKKAALTMSVQEEK